MDPIRNPSKEEAEAEKRKTFHCLREYWENGQIVLSPSHGDCGRCSAYRVCPDPIVIQMRDSI